LPSQAEKKNKKIQQNADKNGAWNNVGEQNRGFGFSQQMPMIHDNQWEPYCQKASLCADYPELPESYFNLAGAYGREKKYQRIQRYGG
jgi:hypothetical protein